MEVISYSNFRQSLSTILDKVNDNAIPIQITRKGKKGAVIVSVDDWESIEETLYVLQNHSLSAQIASSMQTHKDRSGQMANAIVINEIIGI